MGQAFGYKNLVEYGFSLHPIHGEVVVYYVKNQAGKFIMQISTKLTHQQLQLYEKIGKTINKRLVIFYGKTMAEIEQKIKQQQTNLLTIENVDHKQNGFISNNNATLTNSRLLIPSYLNQQSQVRSKSYEKKPKSQQIKVELFWQFFNWDLYKQIQYMRKKNQNIPQDTLWQILDSCLQAAQYLKKFQLYPQFRTQRIQFTAGRQIKLLWDDIQPNNMHRGYERFIHLGQFSQRHYSPQQLLQITRTKRAILNKQKCVVFSLGLIILQAAILIDIGYIYNYKKRAVEQVNKRQLIKEAEKKYSPQLMKTLHGLLGFFPDQRYSYADLEVILDRHYKRDMHQGVEIVLKGEKSKYQKSERTQTQKSNTKTDSIQKMALKIRSKSFVSNFVPKC